jgi:hypothetical protein
MKVFFTASQRGKNFFERFYQKIYKIVESQDLEHLDHTLVKVAAKKFYDSLDKNGTNAQKELYEKNMKAINKADVTIFESSLPSLSVGYMINKSLEANKPTIVLYLDENYPHFLKGVNEDKLIVKRYQEDNLEKTVKEAIKIAAQKTDKRFNFFIDSELLSYLANAARAQKITKSTFLRNLIVEHKNRSKK